MYNTIIKPILFKLNIESARRAVIILLRLLRVLPFGRTLLRRSYRVEHESLVRDVFGIKFPNPIGLAAGFDVNGEVTGELSDIGFGFVEIGTITPEVETGNPKPRVYRLPKDRALVQRMGHPNLGLYNAIENLRRRDPNVIVGCNLHKHNLSRSSTMAREYLKCFRNLYQYVDYFTIGVSFGSLTTDENVTMTDALRKLLSQLFDFRRGQSDYRPIMLKINADLSDEVINSVVDVLVSTPLDGIVAVSGTNSRESLNTSDTSVARVGAGRISGKPLRERSLEVVRRIHEMSGGGYPIIGVGGISTAEDARAMLNAGASLVQIYSSFIYEGPAVVGDICRGLIKYKSGENSDPVAPLSELP